MLGHNVTVIRKDAPSFSGTLLKLDEFGVIVHAVHGFTDDRRFIPMDQILEIQDRGRAP